MSAGRVERIPYELCVLIALREAIRRREIWIDGAAALAQPGERPARPTSSAPARCHYAALRQPLDPTGVHRGSYAANDRRRSAGCRTRCADDTRRGQDHAPGTGEPWITVPKLDKQPEPASLAGAQGRDRTPVGRHRSAGRAQGGRLPHRLHRRVHLGRHARDVPARACCAAGCCSRCSRWARTWASRSWPPPASTARPRPPCGTCAGTARQPRQPAPRRSAAGQRHLRGPGPALVGQRARRAPADSKKFGSWDSNLMTEYHARYGGPGVMIYWHVEQKTAVHLLASSRPVRPPRSRR